MILDFIHRHNKPAVPVAGSFYWIDVENDDPQIWFAPNDVQDDMILLNDKEVNGERIIEIIRRLETVEGNVEEIQERISHLKDEILSEIDLSRFVTVEDLENLSELTDSDYEIIAEKVNKKTFTLTWKAI